MVVTLLDSSAVVAYLVNDDALHKAAVQTIESAMRVGTSLAISAVTWSELLHGALLGYFPENVLREFLEDFGIAVLAADLAVAEQAAVLQKGYRDSTRRRQQAKLRTPDALILATSLSYPDAGAIIGGDAQWTKVPGLKADIILLEPTK